VFLSVQGLPLQQPLPVSSCKAVNEANQLRHYLPKYYMVASLPETLKEKSSQILCKSIVNNPDGDQRQRSFVGG